MRLVYNDTLFAEPIANRLAARGWETTSVPDPGKSVLSGQADVAISDPLQYALHVGAVDTAIVPEFGILSRGLTGIVRVAFRPGGDSIESLAFRPQDRTWAWLASIILTEKHGIAVDLVEIDTSADLSLMLDAAQGALLVGISSIQSLNTHPSALDISDEWLDLTDQPLSYAVAWSMPGVVSAAKADDLVSAARDSMLEMPDRIATSTTPEALQSLYERYLAGDIQVELPRKEADRVLLPLFHYAFYHTFVSDIPSIKYTDEIENQESREDKT